MWEAVETPGTGWGIADKAGVHSTRTGFLVNSNTDKFYTNVGHSFGYLGQGSSLDAKPYRYRKDTLDSSTKAPTMILSLFPERVATTFGDNDKVEFDVKALNWMSNDDLKLP